MLEHRGGREDLSRRRMGREHQYLYVLCILILIHVRIILLNKAFNWKKINFWFSTRFGPEIGSWLITIPICAAQLISFCSQLILIDIIKNALIYFIRKTIESGIFCTTGDDWLKFCCFRRLVFKNNIELDIVQHVRDCVSVSWTIYRSIYSLPTRG